MRHGTRSGVHQFSSTPSATSPATRIARGPRADIQIGTGILRDERQAKRSVPRLDDLAGDEPAQIVRTRLPEAIERPAARPARCRSPARACPPTARAPWRRPSPSARRPRRHRHDAGARDAVPRSRRPARRARPARPVRRSPAGTPPRSRAPRPACARLDELGPGERIAQRERRAVEPRLSRLGHAAMVPRDGTRRILDRGRRPLGRRAPAARGPATRIGDDLPSASSPRREQGPPDPLGDPQRARPARLRGALVQLPRRDGIGRHVRRRARRGPRRARRDRPGARRSARACRASSADGRSAPTSRSARRSTTSACRPSPSSASRCGRATWSSRRSLAAAELRATPRAGDAPRRRARRVLPAGRAASHGHRVPASAGRGPRRHRPLPMAEGAGGRGVDRRRSSTRCCRRVRLERAFALRVSVGSRIHRQVAWAARARRTGRTGTTPPSSGSPHHQPRTTKPAEMPTQSHGIPPPGPLAGRRIARRRDDVGLHQARRPAHRRAIHPPSTPEQHHERDREERERHEREDDEDQVLTIHSRQLR